MKAFFDSSNFKQRFISLPFFPILVAPFLLFGLPLLTGATFFWGLPALQFIPWRGYAWQLMSQGMLPLWNPLNGMGAPLLANYQLALFYPPGWLVYLLGAVGGEAAQAWAQTLLVPLHMAWAGVGMALLGRRIGFNPLAQTISGLAFSLSAYFVARAGFYSMIWAGAWLPWIIWGVSAFALPLRGGQTQRNWVMPALIAAIAMQLLAGHAQLTWYTLTLAGLWALVGGWTEGQWKGAVRSVLVLGLNGVLAAGIAAVQLIPTAEYLLQSQRSAAVDYELGLTYSFWPWRILTFLAPGLFGNPATGNFWGYASLWEDATYLGFLPLALGLASASRIGRKGRADPQQPLIWLAWGLIEIGVLLAFGKNLPLFPFLYEYVPTFSLFNAPARWMIWVVFGLALLAGVSVEHWKRPVGKALRQFKQLTVAAGAITIGAGAAWVMMRQVQITFIEATAWLGIWATGACLLTLVRPRESAPPGDFKRWEWLVVGWLVLDLVWAGWNSQPVVPASYFSPGAVESVVPATSGRVYLSNADEYALKFRRFFRIPDYVAIEDWRAMRQVPLPNLNLLPGAQFSYVNNFDPFVPGRFAQWLKWVDKLPEDEQTRILAMMNVSLRLERDPNQAVGVTTRPVKAQERLRWLPCAQWAGTQEQAWAAVQQFAQGAGSDAFLVLEGERAPVGECNPQASGTVKVTRDEPNLVQFEVEAPEAGYLFQADTWYPGWTAYVDGVPAEILHANYLFRGLRLSPGRHSVKFVYFPRSFMVGAGISPFVLLILLRRRSRQKLSEK